MENSYPGGSYARDAMAHGGRNLAPCPFGDSWGLPRLADDTQAQGDNVRHRKPIKVSGPINRGRDDSPERRVTARKKQQGIKKTETWEWLNFLGIPFIRRKGQGEMTPRLKCVGCGEAKMEGMSMNQKKKGKGKGCGK